LILLYWSLIKIFPYKLILLKLILNKAKRAWFCSRFPALVVLRRIENEIRCNYQKMCGIYSIVTVDLSFINQIEN